MIYIDWMLRQPTSPTHEHPLDVFQAALAMTKAGHACALVFVTAVQGGAVRAPGSVMVVADSGAFAGYISGGCVDADVRLNAVEAIAAGQSRSLKYGAGSPITDIRLPCGGYVDISIIPITESGLLRRVIAGLERRRRISLTFASSGHGLELAHNMPAEPGWHDGVFHTLYTPKLKLRIAGRGPDCLALARIAVTMGLPIALQVVDDDDQSMARAMAVETVTKLTTPHALPDHGDDQWTAFVLMFHDAPWEVPLLQQALTGSAFYIGAVGSRTTHDRRCTALAEGGCSAEAMARICAPIGLIPSMRDANMLAISALAEIVAAFHPDDRHDA